MKKYDTMLDSILWAENHAAILAGFPSAPLMLIEKVGKLGVKLNPSEVSRLRQGLLNPKRKQAEAIARILCQDADKLFPVIVED